MEKDGTQYTVFSLQELPASDFLIHLLYAIAGWIRQFSQNFDKDG